MKIEESSDGTIKVVELDPTKRYWVIVDREAMIPENRFRWTKTGDYTMLLIRKNADGGLTFVENPGQVDSVEERVA